MRRGTYTCSSEEARVLGTETLPGIEERHSVLQAIDLFYDLNMTICLAVDLGIGLA